MNNTKELVFLSAQPDETYFSWQIELFIENIRVLGYQNEIQVLLFKEAGKDNNIRFVNLEKRYRDRNVKFFWYEDTENFLKEALILDYIPLIRPHMFVKHFTKYPELQDKTIFYHDSDFIFTKQWDFDKLKDDDINYLSDTSSYLGAKYFEFRKYFVKPEMLDEYLRRDILQEAADIVGIDKNIIVQNEYCTGGAQHILKNIDAQFWQDVKTDSYKLREFFLKDISKYFTDSKEGFQNGWVADMWALLWNLWKRRRPVSTPKEMDFCWPDYPANAFKFCNMYHDTGVTVQNAHYLFNKKKIEYLTGTATPFTEDLSYVSNDYCSSVYRNMIQLVKNTYYKNSIKK